MRSVRLAPVLAVVALSILPVSGRAHPDVAQWTRVIVKEAFISRKTSLQYRDVFSAAEFGWHLRLNGRRLARGDLYADLYVPVGPGVTLQMVLVERDVFSDDIVKSFDLKQSGRYKVTANGDWARIERTVFRPDDKSGADARPAGARLVRVGERVRGSVSFLQGDYTDYVRVNQSAALLFVRRWHEGDCRTDTPGGHGVLYPGKAGSYFSVLELERPGPVRIRGRVGGGQIGYSFEVIGGSKTVRRNAIRGLLLKRFARDDHFRTSSYYADFAKLMASFDLEGSLRFCRAVEPRRAVTTRIACAFFLYKSGTPEDVRRLERAFPGELKAYRDSVKSARPR